MATLTDKPLYSANTTYTPSDFRAILGGLWATGGVVNVAAGTFVTTQSGTPGMSVVTGPGMAVIEDSRGTAPNRMILATHTTAATTLAIAVADPTNPRIDLVIVRVKQIEMGDASDVATLEVVTGTPAGSPSAPATPSGALALYQVTVGAAVTSVVTANIADVRVYATTVTNVTLYPGSVLYPYSTNYANVFTQAHGASGREQPTAMSHPVARSVNTIGALADTRMVYSTDAGVTWTATSGTFPATTRPWSGLSIIGSVFVAVQRQTNYANAASTPVASPGTWTARVLPASGMWADTATNGTICVAVGQSTTGTASTQAASTTDGITWTSRTIQSGIWDSVCWDGTKFIACEVGGAGKVSVSTDGITWTAATVATGAGNNGSHIVSNGAGVAAFVGASGTVFRTSDHGVTWSSKILPTPDTGVPDTVDTYQLYYSGGYWFAFGYNTGGTGAVKPSMYVWSTADLTGNRSPAILPSPAPLVNTSGYSNAIVAWVASNGPYTLFAVGNSIYRTP